MSGGGKAKQWVEKTYPGIHGAAKAMLILTYGAGLDEGLREAQELLGQLMAAADDNEAKP